MEKALSIRATGRFGDRWMTLNRYMFVCNLMPTEKFHTRISVDPDVLAERALSRFRRLHACHVPGAKATYSFYRPRIPADSRSK